jgi:hypothetical protein
VENGDAIGGNGYREAIAIPASPGLRAALPWVANSILIINPVRGMALT